MKEEFYKYVSNYDFSNSKVKLKYEHSLRVMELSKKYARILGFNDYDVELATIIGLLHDIGRFEQIKQFDTFNDSISFDHASYGVKVLFEDGLIKSFWENEEDYKLIEFAIENHNKYMLAYTDNERIIRFSKLIRDMDKLDIMHIYGDLNNIEIKTSDDEISKLALEQFMKHESVYRRYEKNINDKIILALSFVFDINYDECLEEFKEYYSNYYKKIEEQSDKFKDVYKEAIKYIDERMIKC